MQREASPQPTPADVPLPRQPSPKPASRPATRGNASKLEPVPAQTVHNPAGSEKASWGIWLLHCEQLFGCHGIFGLMQCHNCKLHVMAVELAILPSYFGHAVHNMYEIKACDDSECVNNFKAYNYLTAISGTTYSRCTPVTSCCALQSASRGSSANPATRVQRFAAAVLRYIFSNMQDGQQQTLESVIRYACQTCVHTPASSPGIKMLQVGITHIILPSRSVAAIHVGMLQCVDVDLSFDSQMDGTVLPQQQAVVVWAARAYRGALHDGLEHVWMSLQVWEQQDSTVAAAP